MAGQNNIVIQRYLERLLRSVRRSGLLNASPTRSVKRLDLMRLRVAGSNLPDDLLTKMFIGYKTLGVNLTISSIQ